MNFYKKLEELLAKGLREQIDYKKKLEELGWKCSSFKRPERLQDQLFMARKNAIILEISVKSTEVEDENNPWQELYIRAVCVERDGCKPENYDA